MTFRVLDSSIEVAGQLARPLEQLSRRNRDLADQVCRAVTSIALNIAEGNGRSGKARLHSFRIARGSAEEVRAGLRLAVALRFLPAQAIQGPLNQLDGVVAMLWGLIR